MKKHQWLWGLLFALIMLITCTLVISGALWYHQSHQSEITVSSAQISNQTTQPSTKDSSLTLLATGDLVMHPPVYENAPHNGHIYQLDGLFAPVKNEVQAADLAMVNFEGPADPSLKPEGYPVFNNPQGLAEALKKAGFDAVATANNHSLDARLSGVGATLDTLDRAKLKTFGTRRTPQGGTTIVSVKGVKIGLCGWSEMYNGFEANLTAEEMPMVSPLTEANIKKDIAQLKKDGAEFIIAWPHWGDEYQTLPNDKQKALAQKIADAGADLILGSHTHVLEPGQWLKSKDDRQVYCLYSMGNAMSNQREQYLGTIDTEIGVFFKAELQRKNNTIAIKKIRLEPTYVRTAPDQQGLLQYEMINLTKYHPDQYTPAEQSRFQQAKARAEEILGQKVT